MTTILEFHKNNKALPLSKIKIELIKVLKYEYEKSKNESIKNYAKFINDLTYIQMLDIFINYGYKYKGSKCNSGAIVVYKED